MYRSVDRKSRSHFNKGWAGLTDTKRFWNLKYKSRMMQLIHLSSSVEILRVKNVAKQTL